jgi:hypothetical protein
MKLKLSTIALLAILTHNSNAAFTPDGMFYLSQEDLAPSMNAIGGAFRNTHSPWNSYTPINNYPSENSYSPWNDSDERLKEREVDALEAIQYNLRKLLNQ